MTLQQYKAFGQFKQKFKCIKGTEIRYTLAHSLEHCYSRFSTWNCERVADEEFEQNYQFTN